MKSFRLLIILGMFICGQSNICGQVLGYPGATWMFQSPSIDVVCFELYQKMEYTGDMIVAGDSCKIISSTTKVVYPWPAPPSVSYMDYLFKVKYDTVWLFTGTDWQEVYNFSLQIGDSTLSPLANPMNFWVSNCPGTVPYSVKAVVVN